MISSPEAVIEGKRLLYSFLYVGYPLTSSGGVTILFAQECQSCSHLHICNSWVFTFCYSSLRHQVMGMIKVRSMQRLGTEAIRTQLQPSKPKREITNITNSQNTKKTYGQPSEQLFPKRWPLSNRNRTKII